MKLYPFSNTPKIKDKKVTMSITINDVVNEKLEKYLEEKRLSKSEYVEYLIKKDIKDKESCTLI